MSRMDRYEDIEEKEEIQEEIPLLSRVDKNQIIYDDGTDWISPEPFETYWE
jgi:hypothetical protein